MENKYIQTIEDAIDNGHEKYGETFQYMAQEYLNNTKNFTDKTAPENFKEMFQAMDTYFVTDASKLDTHQLSYRQKVVDKFNHDRDEFGGEYDKMKHFFKGAYIGSNYGDTLGTTAGWGAEKVDTLKYLEGEILHNRQSHQIGFSWKDYAYTKAGSHLGDYLTDLNSDEALQQMQNFSSGSLNIGKIYHPVGIKEGGVGEFDPLFSPFSKTTTDKVDDTIDTMMQSVHNTKPLEKATENETQLDPTTHAQNLIDNLYPHLAPTQASSESTRELYEDMATTPYVPTDTQRNDSNYSAGYGD